MEQSRLIELIQILSEEEKTQILEFVTQPFLKQEKITQHAITFLRFCLKHPWDYTNQKMEKKVVFEKVFPQQRFVEGKVEKLMVEAYKAIRYWLLIQNYFREENEFSQLFDFAEILRKRKLDSRHQQILARLQNLQAKAKQKNSLHFHRQILLEGAIHYDACRNNHIKGDLNIPNLLHTLDTYHHLRRLALLNCYLMQQKTIHLDDSEVIIYNLNVPSVPERCLNESLLLRLHNEIFNFLTNRLPTKAEIQHLFNLLLSSEREIDMENLLEFHAYLRNLCVILLNQALDQEEFFPLLYAIYTDGLKRGFLFSEGLLPASRYFQISTIAIKSNQIDWAFDFIEKYKHLIIGETEDQDIYRLNVANCLFEIGRYDEAVEHIPVTLPFVDLQVVGKRLELKILFELQNELFSYRLDAFKMFLSRTSKALLSEEARRKNQDFVNCLEQIIRSRPGDKARSERLVNRIREKKQTAEWHWLLAKAQELATKK